MNKPMTTTRDFEVASTAKLAELVESVLADPQMQQVFTMALVGRIHTGPITFNQSALLHEVCTTVLRTHLADIEAVCVQPKA